MRMVLKHSTADLMDIRFLALVAGKRKRCKLKDMKNLWIWLFEDQQIHGLLRHLTVSQFSLQISRSIRKSSLKLYQTIPVEIAYLKNLLFI